MTKKIDIFITKDKEQNETDIPKHIEGNAGTDIRSSIDFVLKAHSTATIPTSYKIIIPDGYAAIISSRSGLAAKHSVFVLNSCALVDPSYRGTWKTILHNASDTDFMISRNDRIAQFLLIKYETPQVNELNEEQFSSNITQRGSNGFGSTGTA